MFVWHRVIIVTSDATQSQVQIPLNLFKGSSCHKIIHWDNLHHTFQFNFCIEALANEAEVMSFGSVNRNGNKVGRGLPRTKNITPQPQSLSLAATRFY